MDWVATNLANCCLGRRNGLYRGITGVPIKLDESTNMLDRFIVDAVGNIHGIWGFMRFVIDRLSRIVGIIAFPGQEITTQLILCFIL